MNTHFLPRLAIGLLVALAAPALADSPAEPTPDEVLRGLRSFFQRTARPDGSFQPGVDPDYQGMSDSAYSDLAAITYACTLHKTFGWKLPHEEKTIELLLARQQPSGDFVNLAGTVDPQSPQGRTYNATQALVALHALGRQPRFDPLPVFEDILRQDYKTLPAYSTSFFPLAYLCAGRPIPPQADKAIRALMIPDQQGYLNSHIAATFHASHYYRLVGERTPLAEQMIDRILREQKADGSWFIHSPSRDRHATFDAVFTLRHEGAGRADCREAIQRAARWALACRNDDGGFGHFPGSTSDADANYFQVGTLVMAGFLAPVDPLPPDPHLLSWGHLLPVRRPDASDPLRLSLPAWAGSVAFRPDGARLATGSADGAARLWDARDGRLVDTLRGHANCVAAVAFAPSGQWLATGGYDHVAKLWRLSGDEPAKVIHTLAGHRGAVLCVAFSPTAPLVATGGIDQSIRLWNLDTGACERTLAGHRSWVNALAFRPDGAELVSGSSDGTVRRWSIPRGEPLATWPATKAEVRAVAWSPEGRRVAAGIRYGETQLWLADGDKLERSWKQPGDDVWSVAFSPDGRTLFTAAGEWNRPTEVTGWNVASGERESTRKHTGEVLSLAVSSAGALAAAGADHAVSVWPAPASGRSP